MEEGDDVYVGTVEFEFSSPYTPVVKDTRRKSNGISVVFVNIIVYVYRYVSYMFMIDIWCCYAGAYLYILVRCLDYSIPVLYFVLASTLLTAYEAGTKYNTYVPQYRSTVVGRLSRTTEIIFN